MNSVLGKISSIFEYVRNEAGKPTGATQDILSSELKTKLDAGMAARVTAKVDGTCCWIHEGALMARLDLKHGRKPVDGWINTGGEEDAGGHIIGFRPLADQDKYHKAALRPDGKALFIEQNEEGDLQYVERPLSDFEGKTVELVGPKVNGNKHGLAQNALIVHGEINLEQDGMDWCSHTGILNWFRTDGAPYEGVVVHMADGSCYKVHRGHVAYEGEWRPWPVKTAV
jgi:Family of unknown function (DUF5565)